MKYNSNSKNRRTTTSQVKSGRSSSQKAAPARKHNNNKIANNPIYTLGPDSPFAMREAYKEIRTNLLFSVSEDECKKFVVCSSLAGEGKSTTAVNIALTFVENHVKTLLIECDLRKPTIGIKLGIKSSPGLSDILAGMCTPDDMLRKLDNGLYVIPAGAIPPNPSELLGSSRMKNVVDSLSEHFKCIIFDVPPIMEVTDAMVLKELVSGVVMVVARGVATIDSVEAALRKFENAEFKVLGFIFTRALNENRKYYGKYGKYGSKYSYSSYSSYDTRQNS